MVQWLRLCAPNAGGLGLVLGRGTRSCVLQLRPGATNEKRGGMLFILPMWTFSIDLPHTPNVMNPWVWKKFPFFFLFFSLCKEKVKGRMGRTAEKRERRGAAEATGEERKRGDSCHRRINALRILLVGGWGEWWGGRISYRHMRVWAWCFSLERVMFLVWIYTNIFLMMLFSGCLLWQMP